MPPPLAQAFVHAWNITHAEVRDWLAIKPAIKESADSQLPGRENGPADAYRHLLWGGELARKFGPDVARVLLEMHEIQGDTSRRIGLDAQSPAAAAMDRHNNEIAVAIGSAARSWDHVREAARDVMNRSDRSGSGTSGGAVWLPQSIWESHPIDTTTGKEKPPEEWNWPAIDWEGGIVDSDPNYVYPYGGEEYRHEPAIDDPLPLGPGKAVVSPLSRPVAGWSEDDLRRVMASAAYLQPNHPGRARAHAMVRAWFEQDAAIEPARADATGRQVRVRAAVVPVGGSCEVPVRDHTREGRKVEVEAHCRSRPAA